MLYVYFKDVSVRASEIRHLIFIFIYNFVDVTGFCSSVNKMFQRVTIKPQNLTENQQFH